MPSVVHRLDRPEQAYQKILAGRIASDVLESEAIELATKSAKSFEEAERAFEKAARSRHEEKRARRAVSQMRSNTYPALDDFVGAFLKQIVKLSPDEEDVVDLLAERLEHELQTAFKVMIELEHITEVDRAITVLLKIASDDRRSGKGTQRRGGIDSKGKRGGEQRRCHNCKKVGHIAKDCRIKGDDKNKGKNENKQKSDDRKNRKCFHCHKSGHFAREGPDREGADAEFGWMDHMADADLLDF